MSACIDNIEMSDPWLSTHFLTSSKTGENFSPVRVDPCPFMGFQRSPYDRFEHVDWTNLNYSCIAFVVVCFFCFFANLITFLLTDRNSLVKILSIVDLISSSQNAKMSNVKTKAFSWIYLLKHLFLLETDIFPEDHFRSTSMTPSRSAINKKKKKRQGNGFWSGVVSISLRCHPLRQTSNMPHDTSSGCALFLFKSMILFSS